MSPIKEAPNCITAKTIAPPRILFCPKQLGILTKEGYQANSIYRRDYVDFESHSDKNQLSNLMIATNKGEVFKGLTCQVRPEDLVGSCKLALNG